MGLGSFRVVRRICFAVRVPGGENTHMGPDDWTVVDSDDPTALWAVIQGIIGDTGAPRAVEVRRLNFVECEPDSPALDVIDGGAA